MEDNAQQVIAHLKVEVYNWRAEAEHLQKVLQSLADAAKLKDNDTVDTIVKMLEEYHTLKAKKKDKEKPAE